MKRTSIVPSMFLSMAEKSLGIWLEGYHPLPSQANSCFNHLVTSSLSLSLSLALLALS